MKFKTITSRVIFYVIPIIAITIIAFIFVAYHMMLSQTGAAINERMIQNVDVSRLSIEIELVHNANVTDSMAVYASSAEVNANELLEFVRRSIESNPNTVGGGIWYEPYAVVKTEEHYSAYAYRNIGKMHITMDYHRTLDYFDEEWYKEAVKANGALVWSGVYHDPIANVLMVTSSRAFFDSTGSVLGVSTADMALTDIWSIIGEISVGETGAAFAVGQNGEYISYLDATRGIRDNMRDDEDPSLRSLAEEFEKHGSGTYSLKINNKEKIVYYETLPSVNWKLVVLVDAAEIKVSAMGLVFSMGAVPVIGLALAGLSILMVTRHIKRILKKITDFADAAAEDLTSHIEPIEADEFGIVEKCLNDMIDSIALSKRLSEEALSASSAKSNFLSSMSHEIRTPMNAILGMTQIAQASRDTEKIKDCLDKTAAASKQLLGLINDILDMSKIEANKLEINKEVFDLYAALDNVRTIIGVKAEEKKQILEISASENLPRYVLGDEMRLSQVFTNLLSNAVKFTPEGGKVSMLLDASEMNGMDKESAAKIEIKGRVIDTGIGVTKEAAERLFDPFEQAEKATARHFGGTGLGLSICKKIIELMGGDIRVESAPGKGSTFIFNIYVEKCEDYEPKEILSAEDSVPNFTGRGILVADDIEINRDIVAAFLEETGADIDNAENGRQAFEMFKANPEKYAVILMDVNMPEMDGLEAAKKIRALESGRDVVIIALTANAFKDDVDKAIEAGMNGHVAKPIEAAQMYEVLRGI